MLLLPKPRTAKGLTSTATTISFETIVEKLHFSFAQANKEQARAAMHIQTKNTSCTYHCFYRDNASFLLVEIYTFT